MSHQEKLRKRFINKPKDFEWNELIRLLSGFGFEVVSKGKGSRRKFMNAQGIIISLHEPHPTKILKRYQIDQVIKILEEEAIL